MSSNPKNQLLLSGSHYYQSIALGRFDSENDLNLYYPDATSYQIAIGKTKPAQNVTATLHRADPTHHNSAPCPNIHGIAVHDLSQFPQMPDVHPVPG